MPKARWLRARNMRWTKFSDVDPAIVHVAYISTAQGARGMVASPCAQMMLVGVFYGQHTDDQVDCVACLGSLDREGEPV